MEAHKALYSDATMAQDKPQKDVLVYRQVFDSILEQRLVPNTKLNEQAMSEIFGVSRTLIRQALQRLAAEHVVVIKKNVGAFVVSPSPQLAQQIIDARVLIEGAVTALACGNLTKAQHAKLAHMITLEEKANARGDIGTALRRSGEFHLRLAEAAGNIPYVRMLNTLISQSSLFINIYGKGGNNCACDEHSTLLQSLWVGDLDVSQSLMRKHLDHIISFCDFSQHVTSTDLKHVFAYQ